MQTPHDTLHRIMDTLDRLPESWQGAQTRVDLFEALDAAGAKKPHLERVMAWEKVRYLSVFIDGRATPLYELMHHEVERADPYTVGKVPSFGSLLAALNYAAGAMT